MIVNKRSGFILQCYAKLIIENQTLNFRKIRFEGVLILSQREYRKCMITYMQMVPAFLYSLFFACKINGLSYNNFRIASDAVAEARALAAMLGTNLQLWKLRKEVHWGSVSEEDIKALLDGFNSRELQQ